MEQFALGDGRTELDSPTPIHPFNLPSNILRFCSLLMPTQSQEMQQAFDVTLNA